MDLSRVLPKPKYSGDHDDAPIHAQQKGPRIISTQEAESRQLVVKNSESQVQGRIVAAASTARHHEGNGSTSTKSSTNTLAVQLDDTGRVKYDAIARQGHNEQRVVHASFKDLIPLRQRADVGEISLARPSDEDEQEAKERTQRALQTLVDGTLAAQKPKNIKGTSRPEPTFVRYTPADQMGDQRKKQDRIIKIVERQKDPMEPPKHKIKKIPRGPPSPPPPVMHSPPRKLTAEDQEAWRIPPPVSNWKNPKGYTVPLDKRLAADGRGLQDVTINDKFAQLAEALETANRHAGDEIKQRARMQQRLAEKEKESKEEHMRMLAQKAREQRMSERQPHQSSRSRSRSRSADSRSSYSTRSADSRSRSSSRNRQGGEDQNRRERERLRAEKRREAQREMRQKNMGYERRTQMMARELNRDISEKVALGLAKPTPEQRNDVRFASLQ